MKFIRNINQYKGKYVSYEWETYTCEEDNSLYVLVKKHAVLEDRCYMKIANSHWIVNLASKIVWVGMSNYMWVGIDDQNALDIGDSSTYLYDNGIIMDFYSGIDVCRNAVNWS